MSVCAYIRVSTDRQTNENQRFELTEWCEKKGWKIERWVADDGVSGAKDYKKRKLGQLMDAVQPGDTIVASEISRFGRDLMMVMEILRHLLEKNVSVCTVRDHFTLTDDIQSRVIAFAFGLAAEIERRLLQQRTKAALDRLKAEGVVLGRPRGRKSTSVKLTPVADQVFSMLESGRRKIDVCREFNVNRQTLLRFLHESGRDDLVCEAPRQFVITESELRSCVEKGLSLAATSRRFGVSVHTVKNYADRYGLTFEQKYTTFDRLDMQRDIIEDRMVHGESSTSIRKSLGIPTATWCTWLHRNGLCRSYNVDECREQKTSIRLLLKAGNTPEKIAETIGFSTKVVNIVISEMETKKHEATK